MDELLHARWQELKAIREGIEDVHRNMGFRSTEKGILDLLGRVEEMERAAEAAYEAF